MSTTPELENPCDFAKLHCINAMRWLNLWNILIFSFGSAVVLFLVTSILLFIRATWLPGAVTTVGTIASGAGMAWVVNQRKTAAADEKEAFDRVTAACGQKLSVPVPAHVTSFVQDLGHLGLFAREPGPSIEDLRSELKREARKSLGWRS